MGKESTGKALKSQMAIIKDRASKGAMTQMNDEKKIKRERLKSKWEGVINAEIAKGLSVDEIYKKHGTIMRTSLGFDPKKYIEYLHNLSMRNATKKIDHDNR